MSNIEVWATGRPMNGFTMESVRANVQGLFPKATDVQLARFTAGTRFVVTRVPDEEAAKRVVAALTKAGVLSEYIRPAQKPSPALAGRSEERSVGKGCFRPFRSGGATDH